MPRVTNSDYLYTRNALRCDWLGDQQAFIHLVNQEEWLLHDYYRPSEKLTDQEATAHRKAITKEYPQLPQQVGRILTMLEHGGNPAAQTRSGNIKVTSVATPKIDADELLQIILAIAAQDGKPPHQSGGTVDAHGSSVIDTHADDYSP